MDIGWFEHIDSQPKQLEMSDHILVNLIWQNVFI
jgi:hypothetical protein